MLFKKALVLFLTFTFLTQIIGCSTFGPRINSTVADGKLKTEKVESPGNDFLLSLGTFLLLGAMAATVIKNDDEEK